MKHLLALALAATPLSAQLQLSVYFTAQQETVIATTVDFGTVPAGGYVEYRARLRNLTATNVILELLYVPPGTAFSLVNPPDVLRSIAPNGFADFTLRFAPASAASFTGQLKVNSAVYQLQGRGGGFPALQRSVNGSWLELVSGTTVDLGSVPANTSQTFDFRLSNTTSAPLIADPFALTGSGGQLNGLPSGVITVPAGLTLPFSLVIQSSQSGVLNLTLASGTRAWPIKVTVLAPAIPQPKLTISNLASGQETPIGLRLDSAAPATTDGVITIDFKPAAGLTDDRAIAFLPSGQRSVPFHVTAGSTTVTFSGAATVSLQTGTTAGTVNFILNIGSSTYTQSIPIAAAAPACESTGGSITTNMVDLDILAFDNVRSLSKASFSFWLTDGSRLAQGPIDIDVTSAFRDYYQQNPNAAGAFRLHVRFPVSGTSSLLKGVDITLTNGVAPATQKITF